MGAKVVKKWQKIVLRPTFNLFFVTFCQKTKENIADFKKKSYFCSR